MKKSWDVVMVPHVEVYAVVNAVAPWNMRTAAVTRLTSHEPIFWLNEVAPWNIEDMSVTLLTSHELMS